MVSKLPLSGYILGLDVGGKRIGTALTSVIARLPQPGPVINADDHVFDEINKLIAREEIKLIIVGIPRNLDGAETAQSQKIRDFAYELGQNVNIPIEFAEESLSSKRADDLIRSNTFKNVSQDSLAACFILEEFLGTIE